MAPVLLLLVLIMRFICPIIVLRIGNLDAARIGGMMSAYHYLLLKNAGYYKKRYFDVWCINTNYSLEISNQQWLKCGVII